MGCWAFMRLAGLLISLSPLLEHVFSFGWEENFLAETDIAIPSKMMIQRLAGFYQEVSVWEEESSVLCLTEMVIVI